MAVLEPHGGAGNDREGYDRVFTARPDRLRLDHGNLIPPSIMAVVWRCHRQRCRSAGCSWASCRASWIGIGLDLLPLFRPGRHRSDGEHRANLPGALKDLALPLMIPVIIMGGILTGWFTPTEAGMTRPSTSRR